MEKSIEADKKNISTIGDALDTSFNHCKFDAAKNNKYTSKYCSLKLQTEDFNGFNKIFDSAKYISLYMIGGSVIFTSCLIAGVIYLISKRREIRAFTIQQTMPVTQEVIDKMSPTIGNAAGTIGKDIAKGIASGIKEGLKNNEEQK